MYSVTVVAISWSGCAEMSVGRYSIFPVAQSTRIFFAARAGRRRQTELRKIRKNLPVFAVVGIRQIERSRGRGAIIANHALARPQNKIHGAAFRIALISIEIVIVDAGVQLGETLHISRANIRRIPGIVDRLRIRCCRAGDILA